VWWQKRSEMVAKTKDPREKSRRGDKATAKLTLADSAKPSHHRPNRAKKMISRVPEPQVLRIQQRFVSGESVREISRAEGRSRECVSKIVKSEEVDEIVSKMRTKLYALADEAVGAIHRALEQGDGRLGYKLLIDMGVLSALHKEEAGALQPEPDVEHLTPLERAASLDDDGRINPWQLALVRVAEVKSQVYGTTLPSAEETYRNRVIAALIDQMTGGRSLQISNSDSVEWNRLRSLVDDVLEGRKSTSHEAILAVKAKYASDNDESPLDPAERSGRYNEDGKLVPLFDKRDEDS
jgi:hypothetical protein